MFFGAQKILRTARSRLSGCVARAIGHYPGQLTSSALVNGSIPASLLLYRRSDLTIAFNAWYPESFSSSQPARPPAGRNLIQLPIAPNAQSLFAHHSHKALIRVPEESRLNLAVIKPALLNAHSQRSLAQRIVSEMLSLPPS
jgi:hypothetical protein